MHAHDPRPIEDLIDRAGARLLHRTRGGPAPLEVYEDHRYRWLQNHNGTLQSLMDRRSPERLVLPYTQAMMTGLLFVDAPKSVLMPGLGGASQLRFLRHYFADTHITAWESDAQVITVARRYFGLPDRDEGVRIFNRDARTAVAADDLSADLILLDLFGADGSPPWVRQAAFHENCRRRLDDDGVLVANLWVDADDEFLAIMDGVQAAFHKRTLVLRVPGYRNHIVFAFKGAAHLEFATLQARAASLARHTGVDCGDFIVGMRESNLSDGTGFVV
jgi:spermidine synthase